MFQACEDKTEQEPTKNSTWEIESSDDTNYPQWIPDLWCIKMHTLNAPKSIWIT